MKQIGVEELKQVQIDILDVVHHFCVKNDISYSLSSGTLIGAVRHKGFIPWDDDIDICMLRKDYKKLEAFFPDLLDGKYVFKSLDRDGEWNRPWGKIQNSNTILKESFSDSIKDMGIGIDVFPMDDVTDNPDKFIRWNRIRKILVYSWSIKGMKYSLNRSFKNTIIMFLTKILLYPFSLRRIAKIIDSYIQNPNGRGYSKMYESCDSLKAKSSQNKSDMDSFIDIEFEGNLYKAMSGYDDYLRSIYGNYMKLPPKDMQVSHHTFQAWWKQ